MPNESYLLKTSTIEVLSKNYENRIAIFKRKLVSYFKANKYPKAFTNKSKKVI